MSTLQLTTVAAFEGVPLYHVGEGSKSVGNSTGHEQCLSAQHRTPVLFHLLASEGRRQIQPDETSYQRIILLYFPCL